LKKGGTIDDDITMLGVPFLKEKMEWGNQGGAADVIRVGGEIGTGNGRCQSRQP